MPNNNITFFILLCAVGMLHFFPATADQELDTYLVHCASRSNGMEAVKSVEAKENWYHSILSHVTDEESRMVHKYHKVLNGFAAKLTPEEAGKLQEKDEVVLARPQQTFDLLTTHSSNFLGLQRNSGLWSGSNSGMSVIIAVLDSGITPDHPSFRDEGMPPPPAKWKGKCELNGTTSCNNKIIGARNFVAASPGPPIDADGHGTHCASTAAGNFVDDASVFDQAKGTAAGMAPYAHLAIYKVCTNDKCKDTDILAGMDAAISDGVDVFSLSFGSVPTAIYSDAIAVGSFVAMQNGIFVSAAAGNNGSLSSSLSNESPWMLTVGASTIDRQIRATALLGNNEQYNGESLFQPKNFPSSTEYPLVYFPNNTDYVNQTAMFCAPGSLDNVDVKGKIVLCQRGDLTPRITKGKTVKDAGGAGMIFMNAKSDGYSTLADPHFLPATHVSYDAAQKILAYVNSTSTPTATFSFKGTVLEVENAPSIASFSSRGPTKVNTGILKPDIIGPGVSIIAAWPFSVDNNTNTLSFNMISGTSMACPHLSGIAALIKSAHPDWSPAAIKSYLCGMGYNDTMVGIIIQRAITCSTIKAISAPQLNYPSFSIDLQSNVNVTYTRTVTNVGEAESFYELGMEMIPGVNIDVSHPSLNFTQLNQNMTYDITFSRSTSSENSGTYVEGAIIWLSEKYSVRSPISVRLI